MSNHDQATRLANAIVSNAGAVRDDVEEALEDVNEAYLDAVIRDAQELKALLRNAA